MFGAIFNASDGSNNFDNCRSKYGMIRTLLKEIPFICFWTSQVKGVKQWLLLGHSKYNLI